MTDAENPTQLPEAEALAEWAFNHGKELAEARAAEQFELGTYDENGLPLARMYVRHDGTALVHDLTKYRARPAESAGTRDHPLSIPTRVRFNARRWLGVPPTEMTARLRYRADRSGLKLGLIIDRLEDIEHQYRTSLAENIGSLTGCPVYAGTP